MTLLPIALPAGMFRNGTDYEQKGRWTDGNLVRWLGNSLRPVKGWEKRVDDFSSYKIRGLHAWEDLTNTTFLAGGSYSELIAMSGANIVYDITPANLTAGLETADFNTGYGQGRYGVGNYGSANLVAGVRSEATTWSLQNFGETLIACSSADGKIYEWSTNPTTYTTGSELVSNGDFSGSFPWVTGAGWSINTSLGQALWSGTTATDLEQSVITTNGTKYQFSLVLIDPDADANASTIPSAKVRITSVNNGTVLINKTLQVGANAFRFTANDSQVKIEIYASTNSEPNFRIDNVSLKAAVDASILTNAPINNKGVVVTEERFIFALGSGGNPRKISWCDRENKNDWTAAATNEAGDIELSTSGQIMQAIRTRGQLLIITDLDAHTARYLGPPYVYGFERVATGCGAVSRLSAVDTDMGAYWMGQNGFFSFTGNTVQEVPCDVHDYVFSTFNRTQQSLVWGFHNIEHKEIWWFYPSDTSNEVNRYVALNYLGNYWFTGDLTRTAGVPRGIFVHPLLLDDNKDVFEHESGFNYDSGNVFCETGPVELGTGEQILNVLQVVPDESSQGDVQLKFKSRFAPNTTETTHGPFTIGSRASNPTVGRIDARFSGRQFKMRVEAATNADWRVGTMRVDALPAGKR